MSDHDRLTDEEMTEVQRIIGLVNQLCAEVAWVLQEGPGDLELQIAKDDPGGSLP